MTGCNTRGSEMGSTDPIEAFPMKKIDLLCDQLFEGVTLVAINERTETVSMETTLYSSNP